MRLFFVVLVRLRTFVLGFVLTLVALYFLALVLVACFGQ